MIRMWIRTLSNPIKSTGTLVVLRGNLAPDGGIAKMSGLKISAFTGPARVFDSEEDATDALLEGQIQEGDVIVIRYAGPKGGPGMSEMLAITSIVIGKGLNEKIALLTDGRFSGGTHGFVVGHICPEAQVGGPIAFLQDGDVITIDSDKQELSFAVSMKNWNRVEKNGHNPHSVIPVGF